MCLEFTPVIPCPSSCLYPNIYENSVFKATILYIAFFFFF